MTAVLAMAGSAIGLGNIWRFPYMVGEHGGGAFVLIYIIFTLLVSLPVFIAEVSLGRCSRSNAFGAMTAVDPKQKSIWKAAGWLPIIIPLIICSYYSVIGGWSLEYFFMSCNGVFVESTPEKVPTYFDIFISKTWSPLLMHLLFLGVSCIVVAFGVRNGIERFSKWSIPLLFVLIVIMMVYSINLPGAEAGIKYYLNPDFSALNAKSFIYALGQSFYSLSLGSGVIVTYGSYVRKKDNIVSSSAQTALFDLAFAFIAGMVIMPAVFAAGIAPGTGPGLIFQSIPYIFSTMADESVVAGIIIPVLFFLTIVIAAITSIISMIEVCASFLMEHYGFNRRKAVTLLFIICGAIGAVCSMSFGCLSDVKLFGKNIFGAMDSLVSNILMMGLALLNVVFVGFVMKKEDLRAEITNEGKKNLKIFPVIYFLIRWVAPIAIAIIFCSNFIL